MKNIDKNELIDYFLNNNQSGYKTKEIHINKNFDGLMNIINDYNKKYFNVDLPFTQKLYNYLYEITEIPKCDNCDGQIKWRGIFTEGYLKNCSKECKYKSKLRVERIKTTNLNKYGVDSVLQYFQFKNKRWNTMNTKIIKKFGLIGYDVIECGKDNLIIKHPDGHIFSGNRKLLCNRFNDGFEISTQLLPIKSICSTYELEIQNFLKSLNIEFVIGNRKILGGKEIDIYLVKYYVGIEFDGLYWHSNLYVSNDYHLNKTELCEKKYIELLHIFEDEWINKKEIVKSIIKKKLGIIGNKIFVNECNLKEIDVNLSKEFLDDNHIQGNVNSKFNIGLFYNGELVSVMAFSEMSVGGECELLRYCNKLNTQIINAANRQLNYFIKTYQPKSIIAYADRRYSRGSLFKQLGFIFVSNTKPNYWYVLKNEIVREQGPNYNVNVRIKEEFDLNNPENEIMLERLKIYDCGSMKFEMVLK